MADGLNQEFYNLKNLRCTLKNRQSGLIDLSIKRNPVYAKKWPGQAVVPSQAWIGEDFPDISATIYNDSNFAFADAVPNAPIESFDLVSITEGDTSFLDDEFWARFPPSAMCFGGADTTINGTDVSSFKVPIMCNVLNPGADGGFGP